MPRSGLYKYYTDVKQMFRLRNLIHLIPPLVIIPSSASVHIQGDERGSICSSAHPAVGVLVISQGIQHCTAITFPMNKYSNTKDVTHSIIYGSYKKNLYHTLHHKKTLTRLKDRLS